MYDLHTWYIGGILPYTAKLDDYVLPPIEPTISSTKRIRKMNILTGQTYPLCNVPPFKHGFHIWPYEGKPIYTSPVVCPCHVWAWLLIVDSS